MKEIKISVRELVEFIYKSGDLDSSYRSVTRALKGVKAHQILQSKADENYSKEVFLKHEFNLDNILFIIEGRADGIISEPESITIDEIKSTYKNLDDIDENYNLKHWAQAKCYGYFYCLKKNMEVINIQLRYYHLETKKIKSFNKKYYINDLEEFFNNMLKNYIKWAKLITENKQESSISIEKLQFPFNKYREGQRKFAIAVYKSILNNKKLFVQAPTGVGKTISTLFPAIKALNSLNNQKIYYLTAKSTTKQVASDTIKIMLDKGLNLKVIVLTAKEKICFNEECICEPDFCKYAKGYFNKVNEALYEALSNHNLYLREYIEELCRKHIVCPFEFSLDLSLKCDITICDYNYFFDPRVSLKREFSLSARKEIILVDEAHNLVDRTRNMYSVEILKEDILDVSRLLKNCNSNMYKSLREINKQLLLLKKEMDDTEKTVILSEEPNNLVSKMRNFITLCDEWLEKNKSHKFFKEVLDIYFQIVSFIRIYEITDENFCYYIEKKDNKFKIKIFCINPSQILLETTKNIGSVIYFSATLTPLTYFRYILGGEKEDYMLKLKSPFNNNKFCLSLVKELSMNYKNRDNNIEQLCKYINNIINNQIGNYMVFFPSYNYLNKVFESYERIYDCKSIIVHKPNMTEIEYKAFIDMFYRNENLTAFTVIGGTFAEGIDLTEDKLIGAIVISTGIPQICFERDIIKNFFDKKYNMGFEFAYMYPGFNKVLQASGRVIRTEKDKGTITLIDSRFLHKRYLDLFPEHWKNYNIVYNLNNLINYQNEFWKK